MIRLQEAGLISVLPTYIKEDTDVQAISYAIQMEMRKLSQYVSNSALYGNIDTLPEFLLDILAIELRSQCYEESLTIEVKREIIRNSLAWYSKSGTVSAVEELIQVVFGKGELEEWFQFGGQPGTFRIRLRLGDSDIPVDIHDIWRKIRWYKRLSAHLVGIGIGYYFRVPILYRNAITFRFAFYPCFNLRPLCLDESWVLDGRQSLDGYNNTDTVDLHPVSMTIRSSVYADTRENVCLRILSKTNVTSDFSVALRICGKVDHKIETAACIRIRFIAACPISTRASMHKENIMDDTWELDGSRNLDGGDYLL